MNVVCLSGNICKDLEISYTKNNKAVLQNTIAVRNKKKDDLGNYQSDFIEFVLFENKANYLQTYGKKGDLIEINGKLRVDTWTTDTGEYKTRSYIVADDIKILTSRPKNENQFGVVNSEPVSENIEEASKEELPF